MSEIVAHSEMLSKQRSDGAIKGAQIRRDKAREGARTKDELKLMTSVAQAKDIPVSPSPSPSPSQENTIETTSLVKKPEGFSCPPWFDGAAGDKQARNELCCGMSNWACSMLDITVS